MLPTSPLALHDITARTEETAGEEPGLLSAIGNLSSRIVESLQGGTERRRAGLRVDPVVEADLEAPLEVDGARSHEVVVASKPTPFESTTAPALATAPTLASTPASAPTAASASPPAASVGVQPLPLPPPPDAGASPVRPSFHRRRSFTAPQLKSWHEPLSRSQPFEQSLAHPGKKSDGSSVPGCFSRNATQTSWALPQRMRAASMTADNPSMHMFLDGPGLGSPLAKDAMFLPRVFAHRCTTLAAAIQHLMIYPLLLSGVAYLAAVTVNAPEARERELLCYVQPIQAYTGLALALTSLAAAYHAESPSASVPASKLTPPKKPRMSYTELTMSAAVGAFVAHYHITPHAADKPVPSVPLVVALTCLWAAFMRAVCSRGRYALAICRKTSASISAQQVGTHTCVARTKLAFTRAVVIFNMTTAGLALLLLVWTIQATLIILGANVRDMLDVASTSVVNGSIAADVPSLTDAFCTSALSPDVCRYLLSKGGLVGLIFTNVFIRLGHFSVPVTGATSGGTTLLFVTPALAHALTAFCSLMTLVALAMHDRSPAHFALALTIGLPAHACHIAFGALRMIDRIVVKHRMLSRGPIVITCGRMPTGESFRKQASDRTSTKNVVPDDAMPSPHTVSGASTAALCSPASSPFILHNGPASVSVSGHAEAAESSSFRQSSFVESFKARNSFIPADSPPIHPSAASENSVGSLEGSVHMGVSPEASAAAQLPRFQRPLRILCIDGGGARGMAAVVQLRAIERACGQPLHEMFDLICGTSIGSALTTAMAMQQPTSSMLNMLELLSWRGDSTVNSGRGVFTRASNWTLLQSGARITAKHMEEMLHWCCKTIGASDQPMQRATEPAPVGASTHEEHENWRKSAEHAIDGRRRPVTPCLCTVASKMTRGSEVTPWVNSNYSREGAFTYTGASDWSAFEMIRASSAAPTYFPAYVHKDGATYVDGALVANNPAKVALAEAHALFGGRPIGCFVSIGCGKETKNADEEVGTDKSVLYWVMKMIAIPVSVYATHKEVQQQLKYHNHPSLPEPAYFRLDPTHDFELGECKEERVKSMAQVTSEYVMKQKEKKVNAIAASLLMLSGAIDADPVLLQRIATKKADPEDVQSALLCGGGVPVHILRARDERAARAAKVLSKAERPRTVFGAAGLRATPNATPKGSPRVTPRSGQSPRARQTPRSGQSPRAAGLSRIRRL